MSGRAVAAGTSLVAGAETRVSRSLPRLFGSIAAVGAVLAAVPLWVGDSRVRMGVAILGLAFACYAIGFNLIFGSTGQLFLCVGALAGVGGYGTALLADRVGVPVVAALVLAALGAALVGGLLSWVAVRRSLGVIFAGIITLIFALSFENLVLGASTITGGDSGVQVSAGSGTFLRDRTTAYYVMLGLVLLCLVVHGLLRRSRVGWAFRALRDDEVAAELAGVDVARYRVYAALVGSAMLGLAGGTYALIAGRVSPTTYGFAQVDVVVIVMLAFGGIGTLVGPVLGATVFTILDELLIELGQLRLLAYGVLIIVLFLWIRRGLIPTLAGLVRRKPGSPPGTAPDGEPG